MQDRDTSLPLAPGRDPDRVRAALASCNCWDDVAALGILFHGTCEEISGDLHGGGYDGVFWTAERPSVAQAYIPRSGSTSYIHAPDADERGDRLRPSKHIGFVMRWALDRAGVTLEDLDVEWNGLQAWSWTIPDGWPNEGDLEDWIRSQGYEPNDHGVFEVSTRYDETGERMMPAEWRLPGQLIICLPGADFEAREADWSEEALGYTSHNRVGDFETFAHRGLDAFHMEDKLQSDEMGNVGHESIGILPAGLPKLAWLAIPALRHDGPDMDVFQNPETPAFTSFMKTLNPNYRTREEIALDQEKSEPKPQKRYAVMTDSHRPYDRNHLARMAPDRSRASGFWTDDDPDAVWLMDRETAEEIVANLGYNNPRIVGEEKAIKRITQQREARLEARARATDPFKTADANPAVDNPSPDGP